MMQELEEFREEGSAEITRKKVNDVLSGFERHAGLPFIRPDYDTWIVDLPSTRVHIKRNGPFVTMASELMNDVQGLTEGTFYREALQISASMTRVHLGIENNRITLNSERSANEITPESVAEDLVYHHKGKELLTDSLIRRAHDLGLKWRLSGEDQVLPLDAG